MDDISMENWQKVKDAMEASGNTDNFYYKRACAVLAGQKDPAHGAGRIGQIGGRYRDGLGDGNGHGAAAGVSAVSGVQHGGLGLVNGHRSALRWCGCSR